MATIQLKTSFFPLAFLLYLFPAKAVLDGGEPQKVGWGETALPVPPGSHTLKVYFPYLFGPAGKSETQLDLSEGQTVHVAYRAPWLVFMAGKVTVS